MLVAIKKEVKFVPVEATGVLELDEMVWPGFLLSGYIDIPSRSSSSKPRSVSTRKHLSPTPTSLRSA
jgi:hypothetical protein